MSQSVRPSDNPRTTRTQTRVKIGDGSFGEVFKQTMWQGEQSRGNSLVKKSKDPNYGNQSLRHQIQMYRHLAPLQGIRQYIPQFIDSGQQDGLTYLRTQYQDNTTDLFMFLNSLTPENAWYNESSYQTVRDVCSSIGHQLIDAVLRFHAHDIAHGDIKFENVLVNIQNFRIKLIDFGMTMIKDDPMFPIRLRGTRGMAPHQLHGQRRKRTFDTIDDIKAYDLWATGIILIRLIISVLSKFFATHSKILDRTYEKREQVFHTLTKVFKTMCDQKNPSGISWPTYKHIDQKILPHFFPKYEFHCFERNPTERCILTKTEPLRQPQQLQRKPSAKQSTQSRPRQLQRKPSAQQST